jgi:hypothetical protein
MKTTATSVLHEATHRIPGVPAHESTPARHGRTNAVHHPRPSNPAHNHGRAPRVFVAWQNWIAKLARRLSARTR